PRTKPSAGRIVIVDVDERSLQKFGQWPWRRDVIADLLDRLRRAGAAVVAFDIMFPEPDRFVDPTGRLRPDVVLAESLGRGRVVLGYGFTFDPAADEPPTCVLHPVPATL